MERIIRDDVYKVVTPAQQAGGQAVTAFQKTCSLMPLLQQDKHKKALEISQILYRIRYRTDTIFVLEKGYATTLVISP